MKKHAAAIAAALILTATGCTDSPVPRPAAAPASASDDIDGYLQQHGLAGLSAIQIVERLEATNADREAGLAGSVRPDQLVLTDSRHSVTMPIPDQFYLSVAPYVQQTHDCFNHNLASCQGELIAKPLSVRIISAQGAVLVDETVTTHPNGFYGFWLPRNIHATIAVSYQGKTGTKDVSTGLDAPTCLTTLYLT